MMNNIKLYFLGVKVALANRMAYRADFYISLFIMLISELFVPLLTYIIYQNGASFPGWSFNEVLLIQAVFMLAKGIAFPFFFGMVWNTLGQVREGTFDLVLIKPKSTLFMMIVSGIDAEDIGKFIGGLGLFSLALINIPSPSFEQWITFLLFFLLSLLTLFGFGVLMAAIVIKWVGNGRVYEIFEAVTRFGMYPATIYSKFFANILSYAIPISMMGFIPASILLGKSDNMIWISAICTVVFVGICLKIWNLMIRYYTSAGG